MDVMSSYDKNYLLISQKHRVNINLLSRYIPDWMIGLRFLSDLQPNRWEEIILVICRAKLYPYTVDRLISKMASIMALDK